MFKLVRIVLVAILTIGVGTPGFCQGEAHEVVPLAFVWEPVGSFTGNINQVKRLFLEFSSIIGVNQGTKNHTYNFLAFHDAGFDNMLAPAVNLRMPVVTDAEGTGASEFYHSPVEGDEDAIWKDFVVTNGAQIVKASARIQLFNVFGLTYNHENELSERTYIIYGEGGL